MRLSWARFLTDLEEGRDQEAVLQFECRGAFLTFRSKLIEVVRPAMLSTETMKLFGVVPTHVTLTFANGVRLNLFLKHVEKLVRRGDGVVVTFRGEHNSKNQIAIFPPGQRHRQCTG